MKLKFYIVTFVGVVIFIFGSVLNNIPDLNLPDFIYHYSALWTIFTWWIFAFLIFYFKFKWKFFDSFRFAILSDLCLWVLPFLLLFLERFKNKQTGNINIPDLFVLFQIFFAIFIVLSYIYLSKKISALKKFLDKKFNQKSKD